LLSGILRTCLLPRIQIPLYLHNHILFITKGHCWNCDSRVSSVPAKTIGQGSDGLLGVDILTNRKGISFSEPSWFSFFTFSVFLEPVSWVLPSSLCFLWGHRLRMSNWTSWRYPAEIKLLSFLSPGLLQRTSEKVAFLYLLKLFLCVICLRAALYLNFGTAFGLRNSPLLWVVIG
jgi:hypothetical protein